MALRVGGAVTLGWSKRETATCGLVRDYPNVVGSFSGVGSSLSESGSNTGEPIVYIACFGSIIKRFNYFLM